MCINEQQDLFVQHLMRESFTCSLKVDKEKIGCRLSNFVPTVNGPHESVLPMPREWELWSLFGTKMHTQNTDAPLSS